MRNILLLVLIGLAVVFPKNVEAQDFVRSTDLRTQMSDRKASQAAVMQARKDEVQTKRDTVRAEACERITARIANRVLVYEENRDKHYARYKGIVTKVTSFADNLDERGCDASVIRNDVATLEDLVEEFASAFRMFAADVQVAHGLACDEDTTEFVRESRSARDAIGAVRVAALEVKDFIKNTLKPHMRSAADACQSDVAGRGT